MNTEVWFKIGGRITAGSPVDLDALDLFVPATAGRTGSSLKRAPSAAKPPPATVLWPSADPERVCIGVRVTEPLKSNVTIAASLVAMACERNITPVIFSSVAHCGFEPFGFRVERLAGKTEAERLAYEAELKRFWNITVVVDAARISALH
jgi:hypothetical protein